MLKVTDLSVGTETEGSTPYTSAASKKLHLAASHTQDHCQNPSALVTAVTYTANTIYVVAPDVDDETLFAYACESLASASVMAGEFAGMLEGTQRKKMLALQQVIMLGELALNRMQDSAEPSSSACPYHPPNYR